MFWGKGHEKEELGINMIKIHFIHVQNSKKIQNIFWLKYNKKASFDIFILYVPLMSCLGP